MNKTITIKHSDKEYTLEYTRRTIAEMERKGFVLSDVTDKPVSGIPAFVAGAFLAHHRTIKQSVIDEIYENLTKKDAFLAKLAEMYNDSVMALVNDPATDEGNAEWTAAW